MQRNSDFVTIDKTFNSIGVCNTSHVSLTTWLRPFIFSHYSKIKVKYVSSSWLVFPINKDSNISLKSIISFTVVVKVRSPGYLAYHVYKIGRKTSIFEGYAEVLSLWSNTWICTYGKIYHVMLRVLLNKSVIWDPS